MIEEAISAAVNSDVIVLCMGLNGKVEGEETDADDKKDLEFPRTQQKLYEEIIKLKKPTVFVNVSGSCLNLSKPDSECDAVIQCFYPGELWRKIMADVFDTPLSIMKENSGSEAAFGAAIIAGVAAGVYSSVESACETLCTINMAQKQNYSNVQKYDEIYKIYNSIYPNIKVNFKKLAQMSKRNNSTDVCL